MNRLATLYSDHIFNANCLGLDVNRVRINEEKDHIDIYLVSKQLEPTVIRFVKNSDGKPKMNKATISLDLASKDVIKLNFMLTSDFDALTEELEKIIDNSSYPVIHDKDGFECLIRSSGTACSRLRFHLYNREPRYLRPDYNWSIRCYNASESEDNDIVQSIVTLFNIAGDKIETSYLKGRDRYGDLRLRREELEAINDVIEILKKQKIELSDEAIAQVLHIATRITLPTTSTFPTSDPFYDSELAF